MRIQQSLGYILNTSARLITRKLDIELKEYGITTSQWAILKLLSVENSLSQAEIANRINIDRASCGSIIDKLILKGLVEKELFENDRRSYKVKILLPALKIIDEVSLKVESVNIFATKELSNSDIKILTEYLNKIIINLGGEVNKEEYKC